MTHTIKIRFLARWLFIFICSMLSLTGCGSSSGDSVPVRSVTFAVLSDTHVYDAKTLGATSPEFLETCIKENKLLAESTEILSSAITNISSSGVDFVLITGDLTKDGERVNHMHMASRLAALKAGGKKVFVIPGNHDINNPLALNYSSSPPSKVASITPSEFESIYADFGYRDALYRDPDSLSYIAEPAPGIWLFALDSCIYSTNISQGSSTTSGALSPATRSWILQRLAEAKRQGKVVIAMMHHGILEHLRDQSVAYPEFLLENWQEVAAEFALHGLHVVFTGHFHSHDATVRDFNGSQLYDIETGSLVTYPCPYRIAEYNSNTKELAIHTEKITRIPSHPADFDAHSITTSKRNLMEVTNSLLAVPPYNLSGKTLSSVSEILVAGLMAHISGDEAPDIITMVSIQTLFDSTDPPTHQLGLALSSLWTDLPPMDNSLTLLLEN